MVGGSKDDGCMVGGSTVDGCMLLLCSTTFLRRSTERGTTSGRTARPLMHHQRPATNKHHELNICDHHAAMLKLLESRCSKIRTVPGNPNRISVHDALAGLAEYTRPQTVLFSCICQQYPELGLACSRFKFPGRG